MGQWMWTVDGQWDSVEWCSGGGLSVDCGSIPDVLPVLLPSFAPY